MPLEGPANSVDCSARDLGLRTTALAALLVLATVKQVCACPPETKHASTNPQIMDQAALSYSTHTRLYPEESARHLVKRVPELGTLRRAKDQTLLPVILERSGQRVADFFRNMVDMVAHEDVRQEVLGPAGSVAAIQDVKYDYLILANGHQAPVAYSEYRTDVHGHAAEQAGIAQGYAITSGFVLKSAYLLPQLQAESTFRFVGEQTFNSRDTYVLAFAHRPRGTAYWGTVVTAWGRVRVLDQGIIWVDKNTFQIVRIRTDLLAAHSEIGLAVQTTVVTLGEVQIADMPGPLWLPDQVSVYAIFQGQAFRNEHRYTNYERFRVTVEMGQVKF